MSLAGLAKSASPAVNKSFRVAQIGLSATHQDIPVLIRAQLATYTSLAAQQPTGILICNTTAVVLYIRTDNEAGDATLGIPIQADQSLYLPIEVGTDFFGLTADLQAKLASGTGDVSVALFF